MHKRKTIIDNKRFRLAIMWGRTRFGYHNRGRLAGVHLGWRAGLGFCVLNYVGKAR